MRVSIFLYKYKKNNVNELCILSSLTFVNSIFFRVCANMLRAFLRHHFYYRFFIVFMYFSDDESIKL